MLYLSRTRSILQVVHRFIVQRELEQLSPGRLDRATVPSAA
jgi:hypothetical protein